jgi:hypothetical protein
MARPRDGSEQGTMRNPPHHAVDQERPTADTQQKPRIQDDARVLEVYGNKVVSTSFDGGAVVITIGTTRFLPDRIDDAPQQGQQPVIYVTARLALSPAAAVESETPSTIYCGP